MHDSPFYDDLETRTPEAREGALLARLPALVAHAMRHAPGWARRLAGVDPRAVCSRKALAALPVLRAPELHALQRASPPFGGLATVPPGRLGRVHLSPAPVAEGACDDPWRGARALWAAGLRPGHAIQNAFDYHGTSAAWMVDLAARRIGCAVIPTGTGPVEAQVDAIAALRPDAYAGTPSSLRAVVEHARACGADLSSLARALVGEAPTPVERAAFAAQGIDRVLQWYGTAAVGLVAYESQPLDGLILDEDLILEIVRPGTGEPVADGEVGEIVVTSFDPTFPMIRHATGDLSAVMPGSASCGRTNVRLRGILGRADGAA